MLLISSGNFGTYLLSNSKQSYLKDTLYTPELGSILAGVTRLSVIELAKARNMKVS